jgi:hypothetical protein
MCQACFSHEPTPLHARLTQSPLTSEVRAPRHIPTVGRAHSSARLCYTYHVPSSLTRRPPASPAAWPKPPRRTPPPAVWTCCFWRSHLPTSATFEASPPTSTTHMEPCLVRSCTIGARNGIHHALCTDRLPDLPFCHLELCAYLKGVLPSCPTHYQLLFTAGKPPMTSPILPILHH